MKDQFFSGATFGVGAIAGMFAIGLGLLVLLAIFRTIFDSLEHVEKMSIDIKSWTYTIHPKLGSIIRSMGALLSYVIPVSIAYAILFIVATMVAKIGILD